MFAQWRKKTVLLPKREEEREKKTAWLESIEITVKCLSWTELVNLENLMID